MTDTLRTGLAATFSLRTVSRARFRLPARRCPARDRHPGPRRRRRRRRADRHQNLSRHSRGLRPAPRRRSDQLPGARAAGDPAEPRFAAAGKSDAALANNPAWPKDPDVARRKVEAEQERNRNVSEEREREQNPLRPETDDAGPASQDAARAHRRRLSAQFAERRTAIVAALATRHKGSHVQQACSAKTTTKSASSPASRRAPL